jgi:hypothetical protein
MLTCCSQPSAPVERLPMLRGTQIPQVVHTMKKKKDGAVIFFIL